MKIFILHTGGHNMLRAQLLLDRLETSSPELTGCVAVFPGGASFDGERTVYSPGFRARQETLPSIEVLRVAEVFSPLVSLELESLTQKQEHVRQLNILRKRHEASARQASKPRLPQRRKKNH